MVQQSTINYNVADDFEEVSANADISAIGLALKEITYPNEVLYHTFRKAAYYRPERFDIAYGIDTPTPTGSPTIYPLTSATYTDSKVDLTTDTIEITAHPFITGQAVFLVGACQPTGLAEKTYYYVYSVDADHIRLMATYAHAIAGTPPVDITGASTGCVYEIWFNGAIRIDSGLKYLQFSDMTLDAVNALGCMRMTFIPNWSGAPTNMAYLFSTYRISGTPISVLHFGLTPVDAGVRVQINIMDDLGALYSANSTTTLYPIAGHPIDLEFNWNNTTGLYEVYYNGVLELSTIFAPFSRTNANILRIGAGYSTTATSGFARGDITDFSLYSTPQHVSTPHPELMPIQPSPSYSKDCSARWKYLEATKQLINFVATFYREVSTGNDARFYFYNSVAMANYWYNPTTFAVELSDGSWDKANTVAEMAAIPATVFALGFVGKIVTIVRSNYWDTPVIQKVVIDYEFWVPSIAPFVCVVYGYVFDGSGQPVEGATIKAMSEDYLQGGNVITKDVTATTNALGRFELPLAETKTVNKEVTFLIEYRESTGQKKTTEYVGVVPKLSYCSLEKVVAGTCGV